MDSIRIKRQTVKVEVNDNHDIIEIDLNSQRFLENMNALLKFGQENFSAKHSNDNANTMLKKTEKFGNMIENTFGYGSLIKVFGTPCPTIDLMFEFISEIEPYIKKAIDQKQESIKKIESKYLKRQESRGTSR